MKYQPGLLTESLVLTKEFIAGFEYCLSSFDREFIRPTVFYDDGSIKKLSEYIRLINFLCSENRKMMNKWIEKYESKSTT